MLKILAASLVVLALIASAGALWKIADSTRVSAEVARHAAFCDHVQTALQAGYSSPFKVFPDAKAAFGFLNSLNAGEYQFTVKTLIEEQATFRSQGQTLGEWGTYASSVAAAELFSVDC